MSGITASTAVATQQSWSDGSSQLVAVRFSVRVLGTSDTYQKTGPGRGTATFNSTTNGNRATPVGRLLGSRTLDFRGEQGSVRGSGSWARSSAAGSRSPSARRWRRGSPAQRMISDTANGLSRRTHARGSRTVPGVALAEPRHRSLSIGQVRLIGNPGEETWIEALTTTPCAGEGVAGMGADGSRTIGGPEQVRRASDDDPSDDTRWPARVPGGSPSTAHRAAHRLVPWTDSAEIAPQEARGEQLARVANSSHTRMLR
jgi:hypothetical protein